MFVSALLAVSRNNVRENFPLTQPFGYFSSEGGENDLPNYKSYFCARGTSDFPRPSDVPRTIGRFRFDIT